MKINMSESSQFRWALTLAAITISVYLGLRFLLPLIFPFLVAYFLAWIIRPVSELLYRKMKIPRAVGGSGALLLLIAVFGTSVVMLVNILVKQAIAFVKNLPIYLDLWADKIDAMCERCDTFLKLDGGTFRGIVDDNLTQTFNRVKNNIMPELTEHTIQITISLVAFTGIILIIFVAAILIVKDLPAFHQKVADNAMYQDFHRVSEKLSEAGMAYLRSQAIIMLIVAGVCILGLTLIKNEYAVLLGLGIAIMDALPILGSGIVFVPWGIIMLVNGNIFQAAVLITIYLLCQIAREILEPKLIGNKIGIKPIFTLISMYIGLKLFSIIGFFLGPIGLVIIITIFKVVNEKSECKRMEEDTATEEDSQ